MQSKDWIDKLIEKFINIQKSNIKLNSSKFLNSKLHSPYKLELIEVMIEYKDIINFNDSIDNIRNTILKLTYNRLVEDFEVLMSEINTEENVSTWQQYMKQFPDNEHGTFLQRYQYEKDNRKFMSHEKED